MSFLPFLKCDNQTTAAAAAESIGKVESHILYNRLYIWQY
jgi:hypothetical protein